MVKQSDANHFILNRMKKMNATNDEIQRYTKTHIFPIKYLPTNGDNQ